MRACEIVSVAVDSEGRIFCADRAGSVALLEGGRLEPIARFPSPGAIVAHPAGGVVVTDSASNCLRRVHPDGRTEVFAGRPQPFSLDERARSEDGTLATALFRSPHLLAGNGGRFFCTEAGLDHPAVRVVEGGRVETIRAAQSMPRRVGAIAAAPGGGVYLADTETPAPCLYRLERDGRLGVHCGSPVETGGADGDGPAARFAWPGALAADGRGGCFVVDGVRVRHATRDGRVSTIAGAEPGRADGAAREARFGAISAIAVAADGALVVADAGNGSVRRIAGGVVETLVRDEGPAPDPSRPERTMTEEQATALARNLSDAIVAGDAALARSIADAFMSAHAARGDRRPDRRFLPVSVASARVGRELALSWCLEEDPDRVRLGGFVLWLIRSAERAGAPASDAERLAGALAAAVGASDLARAEGLARAMQLAFGELGRRRDRLAVAAAARAVELGPKAARLLAAPDPRSIGLGIELVALARDVRYTPMLAAVALGDGALAERAVGALRAIWETPCYSRDQAAELRAGLRFGKAALDRLLAERGRDALGERALARLEREIAGAGPDASRQK